MAKPKNQNRINSNLTNKCKYLYSQIRQVPDHQEVYLDRSGFSSVVFDILERVHNAQNDDVEALKFHLQDIVESDASTTIVHRIEAKNVKLAKMPDLKALTLVATCPPGEKMRGRANEPDAVGVCLLLVRLEGKWETDLLCTVNVPCVSGDEGGDVKEDDGEDGKMKIERLLLVGCQIREKVMATLEIRDWGLFGEGE